MKVAVFAAVLAAGVASGATLWSRHAAPAAASQRARRAPQLAPGDELARGVAPASDVTGGNDHAEPTLALDCAHPDQPAVVVNAQVITADRVCRRLKALTGSGSRTAAQIVPLLDQLETAALVTQALAAHGYEVPETEVDAELAKLGDARAQGIARVDLREAVRERLERKLLLARLGDLAPSRREVEQTLAQIDQRGREPVAMVDAWLARVPGNAPAARTAAAQHDAAALAERLRRGDAPQPTTLSHVPRFALEPGGYEPALDAALLPLSAASADWHDPIRTRAGWLVARATAAERSAPSRDGLRREALQAAAARRRTLEERRVLDELRSAAMIVRHVHAAP